MEELRGRVIGVTGASRGIGLAIASALLERGARVALLARGEEELRAAAAGLGEGALPVVADVRDPVAVAQGFERVVEHFGALDGLVNNAAVGRIHRIEDASDEDLRAQVEINLLGPIFCCRTAIPHLRASGRGHIINVSSDSVERPFPFLGVYSATKAGLETFTRALRDELVGSGVRVTLLRLGPALTSFARDWGEGAGDAIAAWQAGGYMDPTRVVRPEVVAEAAVQVLTLPVEASVHTLDVRPT